jgi:Holliday junction resolvase RusA-like endonuclease
VSGEVIGRFFVAGRPRTKGSLTPQMSRGAGGKIRVHLVESGEYAVPWKKTMIKEIGRSRILHDRDGGSYAGPVEVSATFVFAQQLGVGHEAWPSHRTPYPTSIDIGDLDKLLRNLLDALTQSGLIKDDSQVARIGPGTCKVWANEFFPVQGVDVEVRAL